MCSFFSRHFALENLAAFVTAAVTPFALGVVVLNFLLAKFESNFSKFRIETKQHGRCFFLSISPHISYYVIDMDKDWIADEWMSPKSFLNFTEKFKKVKSQPPLSVQV